MLLIENQETFQALSRTSVPEEWLCIWMEGYASEALVMLLTYMLGEEDDALAAWREQAETLIVTAPEAFRSLARAIADNKGYRCEQEGLHELVLPYLHDHLRNVLT